MFIVTKYACSFKAVKSLGFVVSVKIFSCVPYIVLYKTCDPGAGPFLTPVALFEQTW